MLLDNKPVFRNNLLALLVIAFILRMALPQLRYLYYPLFFLWILDFLLSKPDRAVLKKIIRRLSPYLLLLGIFLAAAVYHTPFMRPYIEAVNALELAVILMIIFYYLRNLRQWSLFKKAFGCQLFILAVLTATAGMVRLGLAIAGTDFAVEQGESLISTASDYNFFVLALIYGLILGIVQLFTLDKPGRTTRVLYILAMLILAAGIVLVPSRRGAVIFLAIVTGLLVLRLIALFVRFPSTFGRIRYFDVFLSVCMAGAIGLYIFFFQTSHAFKEDLLIRTGLYKLDVRKGITNMYCRYGRMIDEGLQFREAYMRLWRHEAEENASENSRTLVDQSFAAGMGEFSKTGDPRLKIIFPRRSTGMKCLAIRAGAPDEGVRRNFYVDVGDTVEVSALVRVIHWSRHTGIGVADSDNRKMICAKPKKRWEGDGQWHRLHLRVAYDVFGSLPLWLGGGSGYDSTSLSCWSHIQVRNVQQGSSAGRLAGSSPPDKDISLQSTRLPEYSDAQIADLVPRMRAKSEDKNKEVINGGKEKPEVSDARRLAFLPDFFTDGLLKDFPDSRDVAFRKEALDRPFVDNRAGRWRLAYHIFDHYSPAAKLFGNGFVWLPLYGEIFYDDPRHYDYPHNPFISTVLYSGLIGGLLFLAYLAGSLILYLKYRRENGLFLILFLVTGIFVSVSGNSHFSVPAFAFLTQLPFLFSYLEKDNSSPDK